MTVRPIIFSPPMIRALLEGRKTQTRRVLTRRNVTVLGASWAGKSSPWQGLRFSEARNLGDRLKLPFCHPDDEPTPSEDCGIYTLHPVNEVGDLLWVREKWRTHIEFDSVAPAKLPVNSVVQYEASGPDFDEGLSGRTRRSMHMPRWTSRLTLKVTAVKVERLQDISEADAIAEGPIPQVGGGLGPGPGFKWNGVGYHGGTVSDWGMCFHTPSFGGASRCSCKIAWRSPAQCAFREIWTRIHGPDGWDANPWVVAVTFDVIKANVDDIVKREAA